MSEDFEADRLFRSEADLRPDVSGDRGESVALKGRELRLIELNSALAVAIAYAERICSGRFVVPSDREFLLNALRDMQTTLRGLLNGE